MIGILSAIALLAVSAPQWTSAPPPASGLSVGAFKGGEVEAFVHLTISPRGVVERCAVSRPKNPKFIAEICGALSQSSFDPAKDAAGAPVYGLMDLQLHWSDSGVVNKIVDPQVDLFLKQMPAGSPIHPIAQAAVLVDQQGRVEACEVAVSTGVAALDAAACKQGLQAASVTAATDKSGAKVRSVQVLSIGFGAYADVVLQKNYNFSAMGASGPYYPERALRLAVSGYAIIECAAERDGALVDCVTKEAEPTGFNFDGAAKQMAKEGWMKAAPGQQGRVIVRVDFPPPSNSFQRK